MIEELIWILRERKYIFTTKRQKITKIKQDNTFGMSGVETFVIL